MLKKDKHDGFFGGLYKRNETFLMLSTMIFLVSMFIGYAFSGVLDQVLGSVLGDLKRRLTEGELKLTTFSIFANNLKVAFSIYVGGLVLGFVTVIYLIVNGAFLGYAATKFPLGTFVIFTIPHGIPEIIGIIIAGAAGFRLASCVLHILKDITHIRSDISFIGQLKHVLEIHADEFVESLKLFGIAVVFLIVAAFIEANLSIPWGNYIQGVL
jgi:stage II sporulation protein M